MSARIADSAMYAHLWGTPAVRAVFDESGRLQGWLDVLAALARAQAAHGLVPEESADRISALRADELDLELVAAQTRATGHSTLGLVRALAEVLPPDVGFEWVDIAFQEKQAGNTIIYVFALAVLFVFLFLSAQYESWALPLAIILITPLSVLAALVGVMLKGSDNNILTQIGFIVLIGLAAKNAILIVEFARQREEEGEDPVRAAIDGSHDRLRPIIMTSLAFSLGVVPLAIATGPGAELRQAIGVAVLTGMVGVTLLGLFLTPVFYVTIRSILQRFRQRKSSADRASARLVESSAE